LTLKVHIRQAAVPEVLELAGANVFLHEGKLIIGYGVAKRLAAKGEGRIQELSAKWQELVDASEIRDEVSVPGTGLIGLSSITFSPKSSAESVIIVPARTLVIQPGHSYEVMVDGDETRAVPQPAASQRARKARRDLGLRLKKP
jgi:menaquinone-specific isochorismate synthase